MAYNPLTGIYTPDPVKPSTFTYGQGNPLFGASTPPPATNLGVEYDRKVAADIAAATGQKVDPRTGQIIIDQAAIAKQFPTTTNTSSVPQKTAAQLAAEAELRAQQLAAQNAAAERMAGRQSAYDLLYSQFKQYGLESLVEPLKGLITTGVSPAEFTIKLRESEPYKKRFAGNAARIQKGLRALSEEEYISLEDQYQNVMRNYGLPSSYYEKGEMGVQPGFTNLIAGNVSAAELENRVQQAVDVVEKGPKEYVDAIKQFYPDISRGDLLAYVLDPEKALTKIQARIGAAKIGGEYLRGGLATDVARAEELQRQGVTAEAARQGVQAVQSLAPRGGMLAEIYQTGPYGQAQVEEEVYGLAGATEARKRREKLGELERASFSGSAGTAQGALGRERAMGQGQF
jgi:hypothetical protein